MTYGQGVGPGKGRENFRRLAVMLVKRLILAVISVAFGVIVTTGITLLIGTTPAEYGFLYFTFTSLALAFALGIWLDKFMGTELLPK
jgi:hypothetical protein